MKKKQVLNTLKMTLAASLGISATQAQATDFQDLIDNLYQNGVESITNKGVTVVPGESIQVLDAQAGMAGIGLTIRQDLDPTKFSNLSVIGAQSLQNSGVVIELKPFQDQIKGEIEKYQLPESMLQDLLIHGMLVTN
ncbi:MAG: hypothetical protein HRT45_16665 [Bdellovibrionales bacterium]|nr:hypothetical protein [Bdellovibrionales bacterium]